MRKRDTWSITDWTGVGGGISGRTFQGTFSRPRGVQLLRDALRGGVWGGGGRVPQSAPLLRIGVTSSVGEVACLAGVGWGGSGPVSVIRAGAV